MKVYKNELTNATYAALAVYCNKNGLVIEDKGDYLEAVNPPEPAVEERNAKRIEALQHYLASTDWYAVRFAETGVAVPDAVKEKRAQARVEISDLRANNVENGALSGVGVGNA